MYFLHFIRIGTAARYNQERDVVDINDVYSTRNHKNNAPDLRLTTVRLNETNTPVHLVLYVGEKPLRFLARRQKKR